MDNVDPSLQFTKEQLPKSSHEVIKWDIMLGNAPEVTWSVINFCFLGGGGSTNENRSGINKAKCYAKEKIIHRSSSVLHKNLLPNVLYHDR